MRTAVAEHEKRWIRFSIPGARYGVVLLLLLGAFSADLNTGYNLSASLFYVAPVGVAAWFLGWRPGLFVALVSAGFWLLAQHLEGSLLHSGVLLANAAVECTIYVGTAWVVGRVHSDRIVERRLAAGVAEAKEALDREFLAVGELQHGLLPQQLPRAEGYEWEKHYATSTRAGGDYYDAFDLGDGRMAVIIADASGHGAPAAVLMAMARALLAGGSESLAPPEGVLARLNRQLGRVLPPGWFMTACYVVLDRATGRLAYSVAGHEAPLVVRADGGVEQLADCGGVPLGPFAEGGYVGGHAELEPGDTLVLFTDGVTETMSPSHELFGIDRLKAALARTASLKLDVAKARVLAALAAHAAAAPIEDDTSLLMLRRIGSGGS